VLISSISIDADAIDNLVPLLKVMKSAGKTAYVMVHKDVTESRLQAFIA
jgi:hypothetical protein